MEELLKMKKMLNECFEEYQLVPSHENGDHLRSAMFWYARKWAEYVSKHKEVWTIKD